MEKYTVKKICGKSNIKSRF